MLHCCQGGQVKSQQMKIGGNIVRGRMGSGEVRRGWVTVFDTWSRRSPGSTCRWGWLIWVGSDPGPRHPVSHPGGSHLSGAGCSDPDWFARGWDDSLTEPMNRVRLDSKPNCVIHLCQCNWLQPLQRLFIYFEYQLASLALTKQYHNAHSGVFKGF